MFLAGNIPPTMPRSTILLRNILKVEKAREIQTADCSYAKNTHPPSQLRDFNMIKIYWPCMSVSSCQEIEKAGNQIILNLQILLQLCLSAVRILFTVYCTVLYVYCPLCMIQYLQYTIASWSSMVS